MPPLSGPWTGRWLAIQIQELTPSCRTSFPPRSLVSGVVWCGPRAWCGVGPVRGVVWCSVGPVFGVVWCRPLKVCQLAKIKDCVCVLSLAMSLHRVDLYCTSKFNFPVDNKRRERMANPVGRFENGWEG